jgi:hypothetical protein
MTLTGKTASGSVALVTTMTETKVNDGSREEVAAVYQLVLSVLQNDPMRHRNSCPVALDTSL